MRLKAVHIDPSLRSHAAVRDMIHNMDMRDVGNDVLDAEVYVVLAPSQVPFC